jgi:hypothetical protein
MVELSENCAETRPSFGWLHPARGGVVLFMGTGKAPGDALPKIRPRIEATCYILSDAGRP